MRVLLLGNTSVFNHDDYGWGGIETTLKSIRKYLTEEGHEVRVIRLVLVPADFEKEPKEDSPDILYLNRPHFFKKLWPGFYVREKLAHIIETFQPDAVWSRSFQLGLAAAGAAGCPVVQIFPDLAHMTYLNDFSKDNTLPFQENEGVREKVSRNLRRAKRFLRYLSERWSEKRAVEKLERVVFSRNMLQQMKRAYGVSENSVHLIHPGVDEGVFNPKKGRSQFGALQEKFGLTESEGFILYAGRLVTGKNLPLLLKAMAVMRKESRLVVLGDGPLRRELESYAQSLGLARRVLFLGRQDELLPGFYTMARVFVNPCLVEPFGNVFIESLACGTPILGIKSDGLRTMTALDEVTDGGKYGKSVESSPEAMARAMDGILSLEEPAYRALSAEGIVFVRSHYNWPGFIQSLMKLPVRL